MSLSRDAVEASSSSITQRPRPLAIGIEASKAVNKDCRYYQEHWVKS